MMIKRCTVRENGTRCERLACKSIKTVQEGKIYICSRHFREYRRSLQVEYELGKNPDEAVQAMKKKLDEWDEYPGSMVDEK